MNIDNYISVKKTSQGVLKIFGLAKIKEKEVMRISENYIYYDSYLGTIGEIDKKYISSVELGTAMSRVSILINLKFEFGLFNRISKFKYKMAELYLKEYGAEIVILPNHVDMDIKELYEIIRNTLNLNSNAL